MPANTFKAAMQNGETLFGCWLALGSPYSAELMGTAGFDWLLVDNEHSPNDVRSTLAQLQALGASASHPIVRVPVGDTVILKRMLDIGAQTILVPMVESAEQAASLVADVTYPPTGRRGVGYSLTRAARFGADTGYGHSADDGICLLVQVENRAGLAALDDILKVDGIDGVFIGPADLAADMGHMADIGHADVQAAIMDAITRIRQAGKAPGILSTQEPMTRAALAAGAQFVAVGADVSLLATQARKLAAAWIA